MNLYGQPIRRCLTTAIAVLAVLFAGVGVRQVLANSGSNDKKSDAKHQVEALEEQWRVAQLAGDTATMGKMLSDDYLGISILGEVDTKSQELSRTANHRLVLTKIDLDDMKVKLIGAIAIVTSQARVEGTNDGVSVKGTYRYTRVYHRLPSGQWKITSFEATREHRHRKQADGADAGVQQGSRSE